MPHSQAPMLSWDFSPPEPSPLPRSIRFPGGCAHPSHRPLTSQQLSSSHVLWQPLQAEARRNHLNHRVSNNGKIGWSLSGLPALLEFLTSSASLADLKFPATRDYLFSSGETPCLQNACTHPWVGRSPNEELLRILRSTSGPFRSGRAPLRPTAGILSRPPPHETRRHQARCETDPRSDVFHFTTETSPSSPRPLK